MSRKLLRGRVTGVMKRESQNHIANVNIKILLYFLAKIRNHPTIKPKFSSRTGRLYTWENWYGFGECDGEFFNRR
jgi:hypothetical protein